MNIFKINKISWLAPFRKAGIFNILAIAVLYIALIYRLCLIAFPVVDNTEIGRDYWIARHILVFHEFPLAGPWNEVYQAYVNSPLYYYVLAALTFFHDSLLTLSVFNILAQIASCSLIYVIGKKLFSPAAALVGVIFYLTSWEMALQSRTIWQPQLMQPFLYASLLFLLLYYERKKQSFVIASVILFAAAGALHNSVFSLFPGYALILLFALHKHKAPVKSWLKVFSIFTAAVASLYVPVAYYFFQNKNSLLTELSASQKYNFSFIVFFENVKKVFLVLFNDFVINFNIQVVSRQTVAIVALGAFVLAYAFIKFPKSKKNSLITAVFLLQPIILAALFRANISRYHLIVIYGLFCLLVAEVIVALADKYKILLLPAGLLIFLLIQIFSANFYFLNYSPTLNWSSGVMDEAVESIATEVTAISAKQEAKKNDFFDLKLYNPIVLNPYEELFWAPLEKHFGMEFTRLSNRTTPFKVLNSDGYIFLICQGVDEELCRTKFANDYPAHALIKKIFDKGPFIIFISKKV